MQWLISAVLALYLAQADVVVPPTIYLSQEAWAGYQFYLLSMNNGTGAFAVSPDGTSWGFSYCETNACSRDNAAIAISKCQERTDFPCLIFAHDAQILVKFVRP